MDIPALSLGAPDAPGLAPASYAGRTLHPRLEYEAILANASIGVAFTRERRIFLCNPKFAEILGYAPEELIGQPGEILYPSAESYAALSAIAAPVLVSGERLEVEWEIRRKDGSTFLCRIIAKAIDPEDTRRGTVWIGEDVTERRRHADQAARLLREQDAILGTASIGIVFVRERRIVRCNRRYEEMYGYAPGELEGMSTRVLYPSEEEFTRAALHYEELAKGRISHRIEPRRRKDGSLFWSRADGRAMDPQDPQRGTVWSVEDITEQRRAEEELQRVLGEQRTLLANVAIGIQFTREQRTVRCNEHFEEMFRYARGGASGAPARDLYFTDDEFEAACRAHARLDAGQAVTEERWLRRQDGSGLWCRIKGRALKPGDPSKGAVWLFEDISAEREAEARVQRLLAERTAELKAANERLEAEVAERKLAEERAQRLADHDALTGLPNRRLLEDRLAQTLAHAYRERRQTAVMFVDLDRFKAVNDSLGHSVGDELLRQVAQRLVTQLRGIDTICRVGGDEFVVVVPDLRRAEDAAAVARKILDTLSQPMRAAQRDLTVTPSVGIALFPQDGRDAEALLRNADAAMYHAKESGRANFQFFTEQMNLSVSQRLALENDLRRAMARGELRAHFQPIVDAASGAIAAHEALVRWQHPQRGLLAPGEFIGVAEDTGLIVKIGEWMLLEACRWASFIGAERGLPVSVNLSARQFNDPGLVAMVRGALEKTGLPARLLELEITETTAMRQTETTLDTLQRLRALGVSIAIDDFGTGYSSFSYLGQFPVNTLKIDRSFIEAIETDPNRRAIVAAMIALAQVLKLQVVAEGVETEAQKSFLRGFGCGRVQGYLTGRPLDADSAAKDFV